MIEGNRGNLMKYESEQVRGFIIAECPSMAFNKRTILDYLKVFAKRFSEEQNILYIANVLEKRPYKGHST